MAVPAHQRLISSIRNLSRQIIQEQKIQEELQSKLYVLLDSRKEEYQKMVHTSELQSQKEMQAKYLIKLEKDIQGIKDICCVLYHKLDSGVRIARFLHAIVQNFVSISDSISSSSQTKSLQIIAERKSRLETILNFIQPLVKDILYDGISEYRRIIYYVSWILICIQVAMHPESCLSITCPLPFTHSPHIGSSSGISMSRSVWVTWTPLGFQWTDLSLLSKYKDLNSGAIAIIPSNLSASPFNLHIATKIVCKYMMNCLLELEAISTTSTINSRNPLYLLDMLLQTFDLLIHNHSSPHHIDHRGDL
jgi:hypothetical protein